MPLAPAPSPPPAAGPRLRRRLAAAGVAAMALLAALALGLRTTADSRPSALPRLLRPTFARAPALGLAVLQDGAPAGPLAGAWSAAARDGRLAADELPRVPIVVNFWASWCAPCREEAPLLERAWRRGGRRRVLLLGVNVSDRAGAARAFLKRFGITYPNVREPGEGTAQRWTVGGLPETFFLAASGRAVARTIGRLHPGDLGRGIAAARRGRLPARRGGG